MPATAAVATVDLSSFRLSPSSFYLWHSRLGHVSFSSMKFLASTRALRKFQTHDVSDYSGCKLAKISALLFNQSVSVSSSPFDMIHSFTSFLDSIHCFSKPSSYKEAILDSRWQQTMDGELSTLHMTSSWDLVPLPLSKSVVGCLRLRLILMDLLSDSKLGWLQKDIHNSTVWIIRRLLLLLRK